MRRKELGQRAPSDHPVPRSPRLPVYSSWPLLLYRQFDRLDLERNVAPVTRYQMDVRQIESQRAVAGADCFDFEAEQTAFAIDCRARGRRQRNQHQAML